MQDQSAHCGGMHDDNKRQSCFLKSVAELEGVEINTAGK